MRYSSHMEPLAARTLASHYTVMRQRYALTFSSCFDDSGSRSAGGHRPDARRPAFPGAARSRSGGDAAACDRSGRRRAGFCATAACRCLRAPTFLILTSGLSPAASAAAGTLAAIWSFSALPCSRPFTRNRAPSATPGCAARPPARYHGELHAVRSLPSVYERTEQRAGAAHSSAGSRSACSGALSAGRLWPERPEIKTLLMDEQDHGYPVSGDALTSSYSGRQPLPCAL